MKKGTAGILYLTKLPKLEVLKPTENAKNKLKSNENVKKWFLKKNLNIPKILTRQSNLIVISRKNVFSTPEKNINVLLDSNKNGLNNPAINALCATDKIPENELSIVPILKEFP